MPPFTGLQNHTSATIAANARPSSQASRSAAQRSIAFAAASFRSAPETSVDMGSQPCEYGSPYHEDDN